MRWQAGDLAKCVDTRPIRLPLRTQVYDGGKFLIRGMVYPVREVVPAAHALCLDVGAAHGPKLACRFVKVPPLDEAEQAEARALGRELADG